MVSLTNERSDEPSNLRHLSFLFILKAQKTVITVTEVGTVIENVFVNMTTILTKRIDKIRLLLKKMLFSVFKQLISSQVLS